MINKIKELYNKYEEIISYLFFEVLTTIVSLASYYILVLTILNPDIAWQLQLANIISWICAVTFAYITNRKYVFKSKSENILKEARDFYSARVLTLLLDMGIMFLQGYGLTETAPIAALTPDFDPRVGSAGKAVLPDEIKIHNPNEVIPHNLHGN